MTLDEALAISTGETELPADIIWYSVLDQTYIVTVRRIDEYHATYEIADKAGSPLHSEEVGLSYGALFGPDMGDVAEWQEQAIAFADKQS
jgi:hypothetical protein